MRPEYRPDIDGLRAIAVLSVVLFHAGVGVVSGGYVGVDVFFVISGYLITTIISREIADNQFSIITFYERRFRRILPAAFAVTVTFLIAGFYFLDYVSFKEYAGSLIANNFFLSNFFFYQHAGYFEGPSELKPLLHTWSLAVEEQYYLFFPVLMLFIAKRMKGRCLQMLAVLTLCSLAAAEVGMSLDKSAVFYMLPTRAWELLAGSILAVASLPGVKSVRLLNAIAGLGFGMMAASIVGYDEQTEFPGISALVPVLGAVLVIYAGGMGKTVITRLLSARWLVFVGLISYSLYLWHWPVMAFSRYYFPEGPDAFVRAEMLGVIFILAVVTWRFVETPFRGKKLLGGKRPLFIASFSGSAVLVLLCGLVVLGNGFPQRGNIKQSQDVLAGDPEWSRWKDCESRVRELEENESACSIGSNNVEDSFMLWGDSHARA
ncbi:MAG: acyltransferase, partial [Desulfobulbaceae bacterium]|nr:acyltransferase [Desulfobulbaceae bacterium]